MIPRRSYFGGHPPDFGGGTSGANTTHSASDRSVEYATRRPAIPASTSTGTYQPICPERGFSDTH